jgi:hypothetical protein
MIPDVTPTETPLAEPASGKISRFISPDRIIRAVVDMIRENDTLAAYYDNEAKPDAFQQLISVIPKGQLVESTAASAAAEATKTQPIAAEPTSRRSRTPVPEPILPLTDTPAATTVSERPSFNVRLIEMGTDVSAPCGNLLQSKIWGIVRESDGRGIPAAVVQVQSINRQNTYWTTTNSQGDFQIAGLSCSTWIVQLMSVPNTPIGFLANSIKVDLNGGQFSGAGIEFRQR